MLLNVTNEQGIEGEITFREGILAGTELLVTELKYAAEDLDGPLKVTPVGPFFEDPLTDLVGVWLLAKATFTDVEIQASEEDPRPVLEGLMYPEDSTEDDVF